MKKNLINVYLLSIWIIVVDQFLKIYLSSKVLFQKPFVIVPNFFSIDLVHNTGGAFSILSGNRWLFIVIGILVVVIISFFIKKIEYLNYKYTMIFALLIGGILGNLIDRIFRGYVIDYLSFKIFGYNYPVFNFADICIVLGVLLLLVAVIKKEDVCDDSSR